MGQQGAQRYALLLNRLGAQIHSDFERPTCLRPMSRRARRRDDSQSPRPRRYARLHQPTGGRYDGMAVIHPASGRGHMAIGNRITISQVEDQQNQNHPRSAPTGLCFSR